MWGHKGQKLVRFNETFLGDTPFAFYNVNDTQRVKTTEKYIMYWKAAVIKD